jgi:predicted nucleotidyltransferase
MKIDGLTLELNTLEMVLTILRHRIPDRTVWAFGSRVNGNARKNSDLDLAIQGDEALSDEIYSQLVDDFDESDIPIRVDLLDWNRIDNDFKPHITERYIEIQLE